MRQKIIYIKTPYVLSNKFTPAKKILHNRWLWWLRHLEGLWRVYRTYSCWTYWNQLLIIVIEMIPQNPVYNASTLKSGQNPVSLNGTVCGKNRTQKTENGKWIFFCQVSIGKFQDIIFRYLWYCWHQLNRFCGWKYN